MWQHSFSIQISVAGWNQSRQQVALGAVCVCVLSQHQGLQQLFPKLPLLALAQHTGLWEVQKCLPPKSQLGQLPSSRSSTSWDPLAAAVLSEGESTPLTLQLAGSSTLGLLMTI